MIQAGATYALPPPAKCLLLYLHPKKLNSFQIYVQNMQYAHHAFLLSRCGFNQVNIHFTGMPFGRFSRKYSAAEHN